MIDSKTPVIILCGGKGTRIADVSQDSPKSLVPIGDVPIIWHIMKIYAHHGYKNFILTLGHLGWEIKDYFLNYEYKNSSIEISYKDGKQRVRVIDHQDKLDWNIKLVDTGLESMTGKRVALCKDYINTPHFMVTYGDGVGNIDITKLAEHHEKMDQIGTVTCVRPSSRFGNIEVEKDSTVKEFNEKMDAGGGTINGGFMVFKKEFMDIAGECGDVMLERQPMDRLVESKQLNAFMHDGFWEPMDTAREFRKLNELWETGKAPWKVW